jgi:hypothetical protein
MRAAIVFATRLVKSLNPCFLLSTASIAALSTFIATSARGGAIPLPDATAQVGTYASAAFCAPSICPPSYDDAGPVAAPLVGYSAASGDYLDLKFGQLSAGTLAAEGIMSVLLGAGTPASGYSGYIGSVSGSAIAEWDLPETSAPCGSACTASAGADGILNAYFRVDETNPVPFLPDEIPLKFAISGNFEVGPAGQVAFTVYGDSKSSTELLTQGNYFNDTAGTTAKTFTKNIPINIPPTSDKYGVNMYMGLVADTAAEGTESYVIGSLDPTITFDQAAFDLMYPGTAYNLADYFSLQFSPNLTTAGPQVPEPPITWLLLSGLTGLAWIGPRLARVAKRS